MEHKKLLHFAGTHDYRKVNETMRVIMDAATEIERLRDGLTAITCESINAEAMAQNVLDGLPPYHGMGMIKPNAN